MSKAKPCKKENDVIDEISEVFCQISIVGLNESVNLLTSDRTKDVILLLDKVLEAFKDIRTDVNTGNKECQ